jgi:DNA-binding NarL/FixJ family response regulator
VAFGESIGVLVVDGSDAFLTSALHWIDSRSDLHFVGVARTRAEAIEALDHVHPDLVIVECVMNGADGFQLAREIKSRSAAPRVLLVTFHASAAARDEAVASGADGFLAKYDLIDGFDALLAEWRRGGGVRARSVKTRARPGQPGSRTVPDP